MDDDELPPGYEGQYVRKRALVDQMLMTNKRADFSYADKKRVFTGENGAFNSVDLAEWFRVYNQTQIKGKKYDNLRSYSHKLL